MIAATVPNLPMRPAGTAALQHTAPVLGIGQDTAGENIEPRRARVEAQRQDTAFFGACLFSPLQKRAW